MNEFSWSQLCAKYQPRGYFFGALGEGVVNNNNNNAAAADKAEVTPVEYPPELSARLLNTALSTETPYFISPCGRYNSAGNIMFRLLILTGTSLTLCDADVVVTRSVLLHEVRDVIGAGLNIITVKCAPPQYDITVRFPNDSSCEAFCAVMQKLYFYIRNVELKVKQTSLTPIAVQHVAAAGGTDAKAKGGRSSDQLDVQRSSLTKIIQERTRESDEDRVIFEVEMERMKAALRDEVESTMREEFAEVIAAVKAAEEELGYLTADVAAKKKRLPYSDDPVVCRMCPRCLEKRRALREHPTSEAKRQLAAALDELELLEKHVAALEPPPTHHQTPKNKWTAVDVVRLQSTADELRNVLAEYERVVRMSKLPKRFRDWTTALLDRLPPERRDVALYSMAPTSVSTREALAGMDAKDAEIAQLKWEIAETERQHQAQVHRLRRMFVEYDSQLGHYVDKAMEVGDVEGGRLTLYQQHQHQHPSCTSPPRARALQFTAK